MSREGLLILSAQAIQCKMCSSVAHAGFVARAGDLKPFAHMHQSKPIPCPRPRPRPLTHKRARKRRGIASAPSLVTETMLPRPTDCRILSMPESRMHTPEREGRANVLGRSSRLTTYWGGICWPRLS
eukprot:3628541-Pleurochrysis_carterae.AAC.6